MRTTKRQKIERFAAEFDTDVLLADGFDPAFLGLARVPGSQELVASYDEEACIGILVKRDGMSHEEAVEFFMFNVAGAFVGPQTPIFIARLT